MGKIYNPFIPTEHDPKYAVGYTDTIWQTGGQLFASFVDKGDARKFYKSLAGEIHFQQIGLFAVYPDRIEPMSAEED